MATFKLEPIVPASLDVIERGTLRILEANSSTYKKGALLVLTSNRVTEAGASPASIFAVAAQDGQNGTDKYTEVWRVRAGDVYEGNLVGASAATNIGENVGGTKDGTLSIWQLDSANAADFAVIERIAPVSEIGDTLSRVYFTFDAANIQLG